METFIYFLGAVTFSSGVAAATLTLVNMIEKGGAKR